MEALLEDPVEIGSTSYEDADYYFSPEEREELLNLERELVECELARSSLYAFVGRVTPKFKPGRHLELIANETEKVIRRTEEIMRIADETGEEPDIGDRLCVHAPPRHGKSQTISRATPLFALALHPEWEIMVITANGDLASDLGRWCKAMCEDPIFQAVFPDLKIRKDSKASDRIGTTRGGGIRFIGVDGQQSGRGADLLIVDDPYKGENEANSPTVREHVWNVFQSNLGTRLAPGAGIICLHTRWHWDDVIGRIKRLAEAGEGPKYRDLNLPAICKDDGSEDPLGRKPGEALHPARYGVKFLNDKRLSMGARRFAALYQGDPILEEGNIYTKDDFHFYDPARYPKKDVRRVITTDFAASTKTHADRTCIWEASVNYLGRWYMKPDFIFGKLSPTEYCDRIAEMCKKGEIEEVLVETGPIGAMVEPMLRQRFEAKGIYSTRIVIIAVQKDKVTRSRPSQDLMRTGMLMLPKTRKVEDHVIPEHLMFDGQDGNPDDSVDTLSLLATRALTFTLPPKPDNVHQSSFQSYEDTGEPVDLSQYDDSLPGENTAQPTINSSNNKHAPPSLTGGARRKRTSWR